MKTPLLLILAMTLHAFAFSQGSFRQGYVVDLKGDTLKGYISYRESTNAYRKCTFKETEQNTTVTSYTPDDILAYGLDDVAYVSKKIAKEEGDSVRQFLEALAYGTVSLFKLDDGFLVQKTGGALTPLVNQKVFQQYSGGRMVQQYNNKHVVVLNSLMFDCSLVAPKIQRITLDERALVRLVTDYNECMGGSRAVFKTKKEGSKAAFAFHAGAAVSNLEFSDRLLHLAGKFDPASSMVLGLTLNLSSPRVSERMSFETGLLYMPTTFKRNSRFEVPSLVNEDDITITLNQLKFPLGFKYSFIGNKFRPFIGAGGAWTLYASTDSEWIRARTSAGITTITTQEALKMKNDQIGVWGSIGVAKSVTKKYDFLAEFRVERTDGISGEVNVTSSIVNYQLMIALRTR